MLNLQRDYVIGCDGIVVPKYAFKIWAWRAGGLIGCHGSEET